MPIKFKKETIEYFFSFNIPLTQDEYINIAKSTDQDTFPETRINALNKINPKNKEGLESIYYVYKNDENSDVKENAKKILGEEAEKGNVFKSPINNIKTSSFKM
jgi:hypothetical protein